MPQIIITHVDFSAHMLENVIITQQLEQDLQQAITDIQPDKLFVLTDDNTREACLPLIQTWPCMAEAQCITIGATDDHKDVASLSEVWSALSRGGASRHSCLVNLGGGMVTDLGGFAAATFKRGIPFINIPTTLLSMVDASVGGKTGVNFNGLKNEVGVFRDAHRVLLSTRFLKTLDTENIRSGYAEMLKHGLLSTPTMWQELITFPLESPDMEQLQQMIGRSVAVKADIVEADPLERGIRKALNLGHTIGHAFESWSMQRKTPILHGYAVAFGLVVELYLSVAKCGFPTSLLRQASRFIGDYYGTLPITCNDYPTLLELMTHDKKNEGGRINFTLLGNIGDIRINQSATKEEIEEAMDFFREGQ